MVPAPDSRTYLFSAQGGGTDDAARRRRRARHVHHQRGRHAPDAPEYHDGRCRRRGPRARRRGGGFGGGSEPQWSRDSRSIYFLQGGGIYTLAGRRAAPATDTAAAAAAGGRGGRGGRGGAAAAAPATETASAGAAPRRIPFSVKMEIDVTAERRQVFEEAWRVMKNRFYDPKMHGVNWAAAKDKYEAMLPHIADTEELHNLIMEMIGDMNASHTGITGGSRLPDAGAAGGAHRHALSRLRPGARCQRLLQGRLHLPQGSGRSRLRQDRSRQLHPLGERQGTEDQRELLEALQYSSGPQVRVPGEFQARARTARGPIDLEPLTGAAMSNLQYDRWVDDRKQMVAKLTNGEIGYLHIKAMDAPSLAKFQRDLLENQDKKALIIDQRFNGGGGIDQELLQILNQRKAYQVTRGRDSLEVKRPGSDLLRPDGGAAERALRQRCRDVPGRLPRARPGQAGRRADHRAQVIGTGSFTLLDGSAIRTPGAGVFTASGENMENYGVPPDVYVDNTPADFLGGHDRQIEKAIETLRAQK